MVLDGFNENPRCFFNFFDRDRDRVWFFIVFYCFLQLFYGTILLFMGSLQLGSTQARQAQHSCACLAKKEVCGVIYRRNREGTVHCFYGFSAKFCLPPPPVIENLQFSVKKSVSPPPRNNKKTTTKNKKNQKKTSKEQTNQLKHQ